MSELAKVEPREVAPADNVTGMVQMIERLAMSPDVDVTKLEKLLEMQERVLEREAKLQYATAMNAAQTEMEPVSRDASNPQTRSKYASPEALDRALRPIYTKHGFSLDFDTEDGAPENHVRVVCEVEHAGGHTKRKHVDMPADGKGAKGGDVMTKTHATMSALTYGKRALLKMAFNIAEGGEDDDGNRAGTKTITEAQLDELIKLADEVGADKVAFCRYAKIESFADIAADQFENAKARLEEKRGKE